MKSFSGIWCTDFYATRWWVFFSFIIFLQLPWPIESKLSQVCFLMRMLRYTEWGYWSLKITKMYSPPLLQLGIKQKSSDDDQSRLAVTFRKQIFWFKLLYRISDSEIAKPLQCKSSIKTDISYSKTFHACFGLHLNEWCNYYLCHEVKCYPKCVVFFLLCSILTGWEWCERLLRLVNAGQFWMDLWLQSALWSPLCRL